MPFSVTFRLGFLIAILGICGALMIHTYELIRLEGVVNTLQKQYEKNNPGAIQ